MRQLKKISRRKKISHRTAIDAKWFALLSLVRSYQAILAFFLSTKILILSFDTVLAGCLFDAVVLVQASAALRTLASINIAESFGWTVSAIGSAERCSNEVA